jgi:peptidoglycan-associated lipoprotein
MKHAAFLNLLVVGLILALGGIGCKKPQKGVTPIPAKGTQPPPGGAQRRGPTEPVTQGTPVPPDTTATAKPIETTTSSGFGQADLETIEGMVPDTNHFAAQTIYFEFDSSVVRTSQHANCNAVGDGLKAKPEAKLMIDGHCDERGTEEYNRALGERRALATREYLIKYGIAPERVFTRSFGEDRPADPGHDEEAWSKNRRAEFILLLPPK